MAKLVWAFDIVPKSELDTSIDSGFLAGLAITPKPFEVDFVVRSEERRRGVMEAYHASEEFLAKFD